MKARSVYLMEALGRFAEKYSFVKGVRGAGLMVGLVMDQSPAPVLASLREKGLIALSAGETVLRLVPPLTVTQEECETAVRLIGEALEEFSVQK